MSEADAALYARALDRAERERDSARTEVARLREALERIAWHTTGSDGLIGAVMLAREALAAPRADRTGTPTCQMCGGSGEVSRKVKLRVHGETIEDIARNQCPTCNGTGRSTGGER